MLESTNVELSELKAIREDMVGCIGEGIDSLVLTNFVKEGTPYFVCQLSRDALHFLSPGSSGKRVWDFNFNDETLFYNNEEANEVSYTDFSEKVLALSKACDLGQVTILEERKETLESKPSSAEDELLSRQALNIQTLSEADLSSVVGGNIFSISPGRVLAPRLAQVAPEKASDAQIERKMARELKMDSVKISSQAVSPSGQRQLGFFQKIGRAFSRFGSWLKTKITSCFGSPSRVAPMPPVRDTKQVFRSLQLQQFQTNLGRVVGDAMTTTGSGDKPLDEAQRGRFKKSLTEYIQLGPSGMPNAFQLDKETQLDCLKSLLEDPKRFMLMSGISETYKDVVLETVLESTLNADQSHSNMSVLLNNPSQFSWGEISKETIDALLKNSLLKRLLRDDSQDPSSLNLLNAMLASPQVGGGKEAVLLLKKHTLLNDSLVTNLPVILTYNSLQDGISSLKVLQDSGQLKFVHVDDYFNSHTRGQAQSFEGDIMEDPYGAMGLDPVSVKPGGLLAQDSFVVSVVNCFDKGEGQSSVNGSLESLVNGMSEEKSFTAIAVLSFYNKLSSVSGLKDLSKLFLFKALYPLADESGEAFIDKMAGHKVFSGIDGDFNLTDRLSQCSVPSKGQSAQAYLGDDMANMKAEPKGDKKHDMQQQLFFKYMRYFQDNQLREVLPPSVVSEG